MISHIMTLANGIIGVSVLAMPFCFKQCGIILATLMLLLSSILSRLACHFLIKSAVMSRRRNFEFLAFHAFGPMAKFLVELCIIGFLLGTCIAFFVVVGDLGPQIIGEMLNKNPGNIRTSFLITTGIFIVLPLGLLRNIDSLASVSTASIAFYMCLVLKVIAESLHHVFAADWLDKAHFWRPGGILQCLPIFALALFCQTQLFEIYESMPNVTLEKMNQVVRGALNICTAVYLCVGFFGYIAFCTQPFTGNILMSFEPSLTSEIIKIGFVISVAFSFPLVIFPCRASLNSLLFRRGYAHETSTSYISEARFRCLTTLIVFISLIIGVLIPNIEFVLGIVGSTIGVIICLIFPAAFFISISTKNTNERLLAQIIVFVGMCILILGTYANLYAMEQSSNSQVITATTKVPSQINNNPEVLVNNEMLIRPDEQKISDIVLNIKEDNIAKIKLNVPKESLDDNNVRQEPPVPVERLPETERLKDKQEKIVLESVTVSSKIREVVDKINNIDNELIKETEMKFHALKKNKEINRITVKPEDNAKLVKDEEIDPVQKNDVIAVDAIKKEESELAADKEISNVDPVQRQEQLEKTLKKHIIQQKELLKDIEQHIKELQLVEKKEIEKKMDKNRIMDVKDKTEKIRDLKINTKDEQENNNINEINENKVKVNLKSNEKVESLISKSNDKYLNKEILTNISDKINETLIYDNKNSIQNKEQNIKATRSIKKLFLNSNVNQLPVTLQMKNSEDPKLKELAQQSNKILNINADISVSNNKKDIGLEEKKINDKVNEKIKYSIPIVLKMNNQTMPVSSFKNNQSNVDAALVRRDILEEHKREKRKTSGETSELINNNTGLQPNNSLIKEKAQRQNSVCNKQENELKSKKPELKEQSNELIHSKTSQDIIKTSVHLTEQDVVNKVSLNQDLNVGGDFIKLKQRDLKTINVKNDGN